MIISRALLNRSRSYMYRQFLKTEIKRTNKSTISYTLVKNNFVNRGARFLLSVTGARSARA